MFFQLKELLRWLGLTVLEILLALVAFLVFTVLLVVKVEQLQSDTNAADRDRDPDDQGLPWIWVFAPLFVSDALNGYFVTIVLIVCLRGRLVIVDGLYFSY